MTNLITLDYQSRVPIYEQIIKEFERYIALGVLKEDDQIPSIRELAASLGINPNTVRKAYEKLENLKIIKTISTKGTFVANASKIVLNAQVKESISKIKIIISDLEKLGVSKEDIIKKIQ
ncbi:MAG: GntR family transcriptional regulator [Bacilli bacterium]|nr:GntR family transcriptional regulator [Bacilli bacterium]